MEEKLTHFDEKGNAIMVDVTEKKITSRTATASGKIHVNEAVMKAVLEGNGCQGRCVGGGARGGNHGGEADRTPDPDVPHTSHHEMQRGF